MAERNSGVTTAKSSVPAVSETPARDTTEEDLSPARSNPVDPRALRRAITTEIMARHSDTPVRVVADEMIGYYAELEKAGKGDFLKPEGYNGPILFAAKRSAPQANQIFLAAHPTTLDEILSPAENQGSFAVNGANCNRQGALQIIAQTGTLNGVVLDSTQLTSVKEALVGILNLPTISRANQRTLNEAIRNVGKLLTAGEDSKSPPTTGPSSEAATTASTESSPPTTTNGPQSPPTPAASHTPSTESPQNTLPPNVAAAYTAAGGNKSLEATNVLAAFLDDTEQPRTRAALKFLAETAEQALERVAKSQVNQNFYEENLADPKFKSPPKITIPTHNYENIRIDFKGASGESKSFLYHPNKLIEMHETHALIAARAGIGFEPHSYPSGKTYGVDVVFTQPGTYLVNNREVVVDDEGKIVHKPSSPITAPPFQILKLRDDVESVLLEFNGTPLKNIDIPSLQIGDEIDAGQGVFIQKLENGEVKIKCYKPGNLLITSEKTGGTRDRTQAVIERDPIMQRYYDLTNKLETTSSEELSASEKFTKLRSLYAEMKRLQDELPDAKGQNKAHAGLYKTRLDEAMGRAQEALWRKALEDTQPGDFTSRLEGYIERSRTDKSLYPLPETLIEELRREAQQKNMPEQKPYDPFS